MNIKNEKGITGIDITVAVLLIAIFVAILAALFSGVNTNSKSVERRSKASELAIKAIEEMKTKSFNELQSESSTEIEDGYYKEIKVEDYSETNIGAKEDIVKKVTVIVSYRDNGKEEKIELSTIRVNENGDGGSQ